MKYNIDDSGRGIRFRNYGILVFDGLGISRCMTNLSAWLSLLAKSNAW